MPALITGGQHAGQGRHRVLFPGGATGKLSQTGTPIRTVQLDNYARPDLIKMDIEGGETAALHRSVKILAERHAVWFIALHDLA